jgi:hypothetical protein
MRKTFLGEKQRCYIHYQHYNGGLVLQNENQMHHNDEHHLIIVKMVPDYLVHHDQANQNLTNELSDVIPLSIKKKRNFYLKIFHFFFDFY